MKAKLKHVEEKKKYIDPKDRTYQMTMKREELELTLSLIRDYKETAPAKPKAILQQLHASMVTQMTRQDDTRSSR
jgi:hypothetical protein